MSWVSGTGPIEALLPEAPLAGPVSDPNPVDAARGDSAANRAIMQRIAGPFDESRHRPWQPVLAFLDKLPDEATVLDVATGNGRHGIAAAARRGRRVVALDLAGDLVRRAVAHAEKARVTRRFHAVEGDMLRLPLQDRSVDHALCAAGIHCLRGRSVRVAALEEVRRVLRPGGRFLVSVWARDQPRFADHLTAAPGRLAGPGLPEVELGDVLIPWGHGMKEPVDRFFHLYEADELERDVADAGFRDIRVTSESLGAGGRADNHFAVTRV